MIQETSHTAYTDLVSTGKYESQSDRVLAVYEAREDATDHEISQFLSIYPSTISARRNTLLKAGLVEFSKERICKVTGRVARAHRRVIKTTLF